MPTILRWNGFRFYFFSQEGSEPAHIHVDKASATAKFWLDPVDIASSHGYGERDLRLLRDKIAAEQARFLEAWNEYFGRQ